MKALFIISFAVLSGFTEATLYYIYSCPLSSSASSLSSSNNKDCASSKKRDFPFGFRHTYIQIGSRCYDWGDWNYPRETDCNGSTLYCCVQQRRLEVTKTTECADRIGEFESAWTSQGYSYNFISWNCQVYSAKMSKFLNSCDVTAPFG